MHDDDLDAAAQEVFDSLTGATFAHNDPSSTESWMKRIEEAGKSVREAGKQAAAKQLAESENCDWRTLKPLLREGERGKWASGIEVVQKSDVVGGTPGVGALHFEFWLIQRFNSRETAIAGAKLWIRLIRSVRMLPPVASLPVIIPSEDEYRAWCRTGENAGAVQKTVDILRAAGMWIDGAALVPPVSITFGFDGTKDPVLPLTPIKRGRFDGRKFGESWIDEATGGVEYHLAGRVVACSHLSEARCRQCLDAAGGAVLRV